MRNRLIAPCEGVTATNSRRSTTVFSVCSIPGQSVIPTPAAFHDVVVVLVGRSRKVAIAWSFARSGLPLGAASEAL